MSEGIEQRDAVNLVKISLCPFFLELYAPSSELLLKIRKPDSLNFRKIGCHKVSP